MTRDPCRVSGSYLRNVLVIRVPCLEIIKNKIAKRLEHSA